MLPPTGAGGWIIGLIGGEGGRTTPGGGVGVTGVVVVLRVGGAMRPAAAEHKIRGRH